MVEEKKINNKTQYGIILFKLHEKMDKKNISINQMAKLCDVKYDTISRYYYGETYYINLDIFARICFVLDCDISELISYRAK